MTDTNQKLREAQYVIDEARKLGIEPAISGNFVTWTGGTLPINLLMRSIPIADEIADILTAENKKGLQ